MDVKKFKDEYTALKILITHAKLRRTKQSKKTIKYTKLEVTTLVYKKVKKLAKRRNGNTLRNCKHLRK